MIILNGKEDVEEDAENDNFREKKKLEKSSIFNYLRKMEQKEFIFILRIIVPKLSK